MRAILNFHLASGVNHYIPHAYSMCLPEVFRGNADEHRNGGGFTPPGYCMSYLAPAFYAGGFNPQYGIFCKLMRYAQRVCHLLAGGEHLADIAIYYNAEGDWVNQGAVTSLDEVCAALTRGGFDYDILPADTLLRDAEAENSRLRVGPASYGALIVPGSTVLPEKLLERFEVLAAQGVPLLFAGILPERTEEPDSAAIASLPGKLRAVPVPALAERLGGISPGRLRISPAIPELRYFGMRGEDGAIYYFFCNEGRTDARFQQILRRTVTADSSVHPLSGQPLIWSVQPVWYCVIKTILPSSCGPLEMNPVPGRIMLRCTAGSANTTRQDTFSMSPATQRVIFPTSSARCIRR